MQPPRDRESKRDVYPAVESTPEAKGAFLSGYSAMPTIKDVAEITGFHVNSVRRLCKDGKIPDMKFGQKVMIPKDFFVEGLGIEDDEKQSKWWFRKHVKGGKLVALTVYYGTPEPSKTGYYLARYRVHWGSSSPRWGKWELDDTDDYAGNMADPMTWCSA